MNPTILFDGLCNLCQGSVQFILKRDKAERFRFASLQSEAAKRLLQDFPEAPRDIGTILLLENGRLYSRSTAALRIAKGLSGLWPLFYGFIILPRWLRDPVYNFIARNRYRWFGKRDSCMIPTPELRDRFLG